MSSTVKRRSTTLEEVEKIKYEREERRKNLAMIKDQKAALINSMNGNPQWQFLAMIREFRATLNITPITEADSVVDNVITVCVRKRPLNNKEMSQNEIDVITVPSKNLMIVHEPKQKVDLTKYLENQEFRFDYAFDEYSSNEVVYNFTARPLVKTVLEGGMATCFAYGQTGSGKTYTMGGQVISKSDSRYEGIYAMAANDLFQAVNSSKYSACGFIVTASFFEIYKSHVYDLLNRKTRLKVLENEKQQVQVKGLAEKVVSNTNEVMSVIQAGNKMRTSGRTAANENSSRSHAVFQLTLRKNLKFHGKLSLIDLAGNERGADRGDRSKVTLLEGAAINKSLLALKECIRALGRKGAHLPFRGSQLTQVLRDSFIGENRKTCMIAMVSPGYKSCEHSLNTLRYADRVKELTMNHKNEQSDIQEGYEEDYEDGSEEDFLEETSLITKDDNHSFDTIADGDYRDVSQGSSSLSLSDYLNSSKDNQIQEAIQIIELWREKCSKWDSSEKNVLISLKEINNVKTNLIEELSNTFRQRQELLKTLQGKLDTLINQF